MTCFIYVAGAAVRSGCDLSVSFFFLASSPDNGQLWNPKTGLNIKKYTGHNREVLFFLCVALPWLLLSGAKTLMPLWQVLAVDALDDNSQLVTCGGSVGGLCERADGGGAERKD